MGVVAWELASRLELSAHAPAAGVLSIGNEAENWLAHPIIQPSMNLPVREMGRLEVGKSRRAPGGLKTHGTRQFSCTGDL